MAAFMLIMLHINSVAAFRDVALPLALPHVASCPMPAARCPMPCVLGECLHAFVGRCRASYLSMAMAELGRFINFAAALTLTRSTHFRQRQGNSKPANQTTATNCWGKRKSQLVNLNDDNEK